MFLKLLIKYVFVINTKKILSLSLLRKLNLINFHIPS